jgi:hypothetical protein
MHIPKEEWNRNLLEQQQSLLHSRIHRQQLAARSSGSECETHTDAVLLRVLVPVYEDGVLMPFVMSTSSPYARSVLQYKGRENISVFELVVKQFTMSSPITAAATQSRNPSQQGLHFAWAQFEQLKMKLNPEQESTACMLLNFFNCTHAIGDSIRLHNLRCRDFFRDPSAQVFLLP